MEAPKGPRLASQTRRCGDHQQKGVTRVEVEGDELQVIEEKHEPTVHAEQTEEEEEPTVHAKQAEKDEGRQRYE